MKNSAFLCDFIRERESQLSDVGLQPVTARPAPVIDRANTGGSYSTPRPVIDRKNPAATPGPYIDIANPRGGNDTPAPVIDYNPRNEKKTMQTTTTAGAAGSTEPQSMSVQKRNIWLLIGGAVVSVSLIYLMFNRNE
jgi:hypothetical protein